MGPPGNRGSWDPCVLAQTQKKPIKRYQGHLMGPTTDPRPSSSAQVLKWSVRPWVSHMTLTDHYLSGAD
ncbi:unnamed protein product [Staurois parvus]|uniref:Uncharacterized protein n=1 Tax=Staurois parvus TaxID=386267 RepID=A0ABN9ALR3_9NEOB|nr:unnamed protein product [Staurois parvus]